jgi:type IV pilus assembly protein PilB
LVFKSNNVSDTLKQELQIILGKKVALIFESKENIQNYLSTNFRKKTKTNRTLQYSNDFLKKIILSAKEIGSSDIHFEPYEDSCRVRLRLDGKLKSQYIISKSEYPTIINKLKIQAGLDISEKRLPQDGRISINVDSNKFDIRVSTLPTLHGEKIVLRILSREIGDLKLESLGFSNEELINYKEAIKSPNGIILISGPTGSGKTTTLYATLKLLNNDQTNILTIEDPIEYTLDGVNQVQLKENIGLDFSSTLRTFLRQDPDIIMVGEIRDVKTANMAIRAALTGHLVLSTIHTNSAWATISRLIDMGVPPFLIASTLNVSVAQRLVRKLCSHCKTETDINTDEFPIGFKAPTKLKTHFKAVGCPKCYYTGYLGRKAIYEIIPITTDLVHFIKDNVLDVSEYLNLNSIPTLQLNALRLLINGETSVEEVYTLIS